MEGFWIVQFEGMQGKGGGVAVFIKGQIFGGDSGATYMGTYHAEGRTLKARVHIHNFVPGVGSVMGIQGNDYDLEVVGTMDGDTIKASGSAVGLQVAGLAIRLTKAANLPA